jgi:hypothetical protein
MEALSGNVRHFERFSSYLKAFSEKCEAFIKIRIRLVLALNLLFTEIYAKN